MMIYDVTPKTDVVAQAREAAKTLRAARVAAIVVTVNDRQFDGDETSQTRMARAILAMQAAEVATTPWTLANNVSTEVTVAELVTALIMAGQAQSAMWALITNPGRAFEILKAYDRLGNAALNGTGRETISSRANRAAGEKRTWGCLLCRLLDRIDKDHCRKSAGG